MNRIYFILLVLVVLPLAAAQPDWAQRDRYRANNDSILAGLLPRPEVVFVGNSLTDGWARFRPAFFSEHHYIGRGISGQVTEQMLARFPQDVLALHPRKVVILCGTNDIACNNGRIRDEEILANVASMATLAQAHGIEPLLCTVLPCKSFWWNTSLGDPTDRIVHLNSLIRDYAEQEGLTLVDYYPVMVDEDGGLKGASDGVHPDPDTYAIMEQVVLNALTTERKARVRLTFDDGLLEHYTQVWPLLRQYRLTGVFYLIPQHIDAHQPECGAPTMTWQMVRRMARSGQQMGMHTYSHPHMAQLPAAEAERQLCMADSAMRAHGLCPTLFAYPYGSRTDETDAMVFRLGYEQIRPRTIAVGGREVPAVADAHRLVEDIVRRRRDAVLMVHGITMGWDAWTDTTVLEALFRELRQAIDRGELELY